MLAPLSWLKEYVTITLPPKKLGDRLTEVGLGTEKIHTTKEDTVFDLEITPNRPDLLSIIGVAREVAAIEQKKLNFPKLKTNLKPTAPILPLKIKTNYEINPRFTAIIIDGITVKESPLWLKKRLEQMGQRTINNIVDITNYVMLELGNPLHAFDYHKIKGNSMTVALSKGGESYKSVDGIMYHLPENAVIIKDTEGVIDLCGIKGGYSSGTFNDTKTIVIRVPVEIPSLIRKTSQRLSLRSEASSIFERGVNKGGTTETLKRAVDLIVELAGGKIASELYDFKKQEFEPTPLKLRLERLHFVLGIEIATKTVLEILTNLNLSPKLVGKDTIETTIPTYRNDLKIEEDLLEEVARLYGYNNFPKTLPQGQISTYPIPYFKDYKIDEKIKNILKASNFSEVFTYSLISSKELQLVEIKSDSVLRVDNPVSRDFEYLRPTLKANLLKALIQNKANFKEVNLFELGKVYIGKSIDKAKEEYHLSGISNSKNYYEIKGIIEKILKDSNGTGIQSKIEVVDDGIYFEINYTNLLENLNSKNKYKTFHPLPKYPALVEDMSLIVPQNVQTGTIIDAIKNQSSLIKEVTLLDTYEDSKTFHIVYQSNDKNLTSSEVSEIRDKFVNTLEKKYTIHLKST